MKTLVLKEFVKVLGWILLAFFLWFNGCSGDNKKGNNSVVLVPEVKGTFETKKPDQKPAEWPEKDQPKPIIKWKEKEITVENPVNTKLANDYLMAKDSIERLNLYLKSIQLNSFSSKFEDDNLILNINGIVQGEVQEITPSYTIKQQRIDVSIKEKLPVLRVYGGGEVGNTKTLDDLSFKGSILFQNRKGSIISTGYDTDNKIWLGYHVSIF